MANLTKPTLKAWAARYRVQSAELMAQSRLLAEQANEWDPPTFVSGRTTREYWPTVTIPGSGYTVPRAADGVQSYEPRWESQLPVSEVIFPGTLSLALKKRHEGHDYAWGTFVRYPHIDDPTEKDAFVCFGCDVGYIGEFTGRSV